MCTGVHPQPPLSTPGPPWASAHLVVQVQVVELPVGAEVLGVRVQGEVDVAAKALDDHGVPVVVVQQAAAGRRGVAQDGAVLVTACQGGTRNTLCSFTLSRGH